MSYVLIIHEVVDYDAWKTIFDSAAPLRKEAGEQHYQILNYQKDPNMIVHYSRWSSTAAAKAFFESPKLIKMRVASGVKSPEFIYLEEIESGTL